MKMKRFAAIVCALLLLLLAGCRRAPTVTRDGEAWSPDWTRVGATLGVEPPGNGLILLDSKDALTASGLFYAAWAAGERTDYVNADGDTVDLYDAQLYLLLQDCKNAGDAVEHASAWREQAESVYEVTETRTLVCAGQEFTVILYKVDRAGNPYNRGAAAFGVYQEHALCAELSCQERFDGDAPSILTEFLNGIHYA